MLHIFHKSTRRTFKGGKETPLASLEVPQVISKIFFKRIKGLALKTYRTEGGGCGQWGLFGVWGAHTAPIVIGVHLTRPDTSARAREQRRGQIP